jgi:hypothetical protein
LATCSTSSSLKQQKQTAAMFSNGSIHGISSKLLNIKTKFEQHYTIAQHGPLVLNKQQQQHHCS